MSEEAPPSSRGERAPRVFLSYSHDSPEHGERVLALASRLRSEGVDAHLDQYDPAPPEGWPRWMERQLEVADFVLVICTATYLRRFRQEAPAGEGLGVKWEGAILRQDLYETEGRNDRFLPVLFPPASKGDIPKVLRGVRHYTLDGEAGYEALYRRLTNQPAVKKKPLGKLRKLPPKPRKTEFLFPPSPSYTSDRNREVSKELEELWQRHDELTLSGGDTSAVIAQILDCKRKLRTGPELEAGDILGGRYLLHEPLGQGGFATVWKAIDRKSHELVAVKVLHGQYSRDKTRLDRFFRGARKMAGVHHPGIVRVIEDGCEDDGYHYFVMEYLPGGDLRQAVLEKRLTREEAFEKVLEVGEALSAAHEKKLIHRDVKPANMLLDSVGRPKLTDFDLVRAFDTTGGTRTQTALGTFLYMAPEAMVNAAAVGVPADVYSLAMTVAFALHGREIPHSVLRGHGPFLRSLRCSPGVKSVLFKATAFEPEARFGTVGDFLDALRSSLGAPGEGAEGSSTQPRYGQTRGNGSDAARPRDQVRLREDSKLQPRHSVRVPDPARYVAFLSYAHRYQGWVEVLQRNLERCLEYRSASPSAVFLDTVDLGSGRSWVSQLEAGIAKANHLILVATPEAFASPRVADEWQSFVASQQDWLEGHVHLVRLIDSPLPPFLAQVQWVDFDGCNEATYKERLRELVGVLLGNRTKRNLPELPAGIEVPDPPSRRVPKELRERLVRWLAPKLEEKLARTAIAGAFKIDSTYLEAHGDWKCAASALLVRSTGSDDPVVAALRVVDGLRELFDEEEPDGPLGKMGEELARLRERQGTTGLLSTYLRSVAYEHDRLVPYLQQSAELDLLDRVYVQLDLRPEELAPVLAREMEELEERLERPSGPLSIREVLALDPGVHPWVTRRWIILGDPGSGKTTLLRHLAASLAREEERPFVPVFASLPRLLREREWLLDRIAQQLRRTGENAAALPSILEREGKAGRLLLLLDGFDEVPKEEREEAEVLLRDLSVRWPDSPLVVTSRPIGYRRPGSEMRELELLPLDSDRRQEFLVRWFGRRAGKSDEARAGAVLEVLRRDPGLWELAGNPLYLTLIALLVEQGQPLHRHRTRLYDQVFALLLDGKHRPDGEPMAAQEAVRKVLGYLGYALTDENLDGEPVTRLEARLYDPAADLLRESLERVPRWRRGLRPFLDELAERTGILGPHDGPDADWRFCNRMFREALAAEYLEERWKEGGEEAILAYAKEIGGGENERRWAEPYALLTGRVEDPDALAKALVRANRALGLRALATAQGLREETLADVLKLSKALKKRAEVYRRIPGFVGEGEVALLLLDRLRRGTTNGNDLYFLDLAVKKVGQRWQGQQKAAAKLRNRLYDHIPKPDGGLFEEVESPLDGRVPLWRPIPVGGFWMGSQEGEGHSWERPRHRVRFTRGFQIGAVPVTNAQYAAFDPEREPPEQSGVPEDELGDHPVTGVTWFEAVSFCRWLATLDNRFHGARLPAEEEWEYACRAGTDSRYWSGDEEEDLARVAWYDANSGGRSHRVGEKPANPWGLYDVHGNVWEWNATSWDLEAYRKGAEGREVDPIDVGWEGEAPTGRELVIRGGGYLDGAGRARAAYRSGGGHWVEIRDRGFRVVLPIATEP